MKPGIVINFTPTGMLPTMRDTVFVPIHPEEIIEDVLKVHEIGITMVHLHARDKGSGKPTHEKDVYARIIEGIRQHAPELIICVSTSGRINNAFGPRSEVLKLEGKLKPDMASLTLSSLNFNTSASVNEPETIFALAEAMKNYGIKPEIEIFDIGMVNYMKYLIDKGMLNPPYYANFILGNIACAQADLAHLGIMLKDMPTDSVISFGGVGRAQLQMNSLAVAMGYGVRVGIEDNYWYDDERTIKASNEDLVRRIHRIVEANENHVMTPKSLRERLSLDRGNGCYGLAKAK